MWQVLYTPDVWLLSNLGAQLGIQEEGDHWGNPTRCSRHHQSTGERISSCISRDCLQSVVRISAHLSQILSSNYRWGNQQISQFIGEKSAHLSQSLSLIDRENIISCISNIVFSQITEFMGWKVLLHKKAQGFKEVSIRPLIWVYDITETVLCTMDGVGEKPSRSFTSVKQDWHQLKVNQNKARGIVFILINCRRQLAVVQFSSLFQV